MSKVAVIGSGVVGQATGKGLIVKGHDVIFCDINQKLLDTLQGQGFKTASPELLGQQGDFDAFFLAISTPTVEGKIKLDGLKSATANLATEALKKNNSYCIVVVRSTVSPNTTEGIVIPILEQYSGKKAGRDFGVCMNPEYLRENRNEEDFKNPWIVTIGELDAKSGEVLENLYGSQNCPVAHVSLKEAEMQKYVHNLYNACKISFFNEMRMMCEVMKIDADKIFELTSKSAEAQWNPRYGIRNMGPFGGNCLPKDTTAFLAFAKDEWGKSLTLLKAIIRSNEIAEMRMICESVKTDADRVLHLVAQNAEASWNSAWIKDELGKSLASLKAAMRVGEAAVAGESQVV